MSFEQEPASILSQAEIRPRSQATHLDDISNEKIESKFAKFAICIGSDNQVIYYSTQNFIEGTDEK